tara:strand:- start:4135 stop:4404 length:270 start_codon:yes stop_codon:yes gene_type:complete
MSELNTSPKSADAPNTDASSNTVTPQQTQVKLVDVELSNQNVALNVLIGFITHAQQRGAFNIQESAKIWDCIQLFQGPPQEPVNMEVTD